MSEPARPLPSEPVPTPAPAPVPAPEAAPEPVLALFSAEMGRERGAMCAVSLPLNSLSMPSNDSAEAAALCGECVLVLS